MKTVLTLRITGLILVTSPLVLPNQNLSDLSKGVILGAGIGFLLLSLIKQNNKKTA